MYLPHLTQLLASFKGDRLELPGEIPLRTQEGPTAVEEAIAALRKTSPRPALKLSAGISRAAADHAADLGPRGGIEHLGADGSTPSVRMRRYGSWKGRSGEALSFGEQGARRVILQLLIDDGVPDRAHRTSLLRDEFRFFGAACGPHQRYGQMCVLDFAAQFEEKPSASGRD